MSNLEEIERLLRDCNPSGRLEIFRALREEFSIHPLENQWNTKAEVILEAISRASDLTQRGIRGIIAEAVFAVDIVPGLGHWKDITPSGDLPYDCLLEDDLGQVRVQIKMQRLKAGRPMYANQGYRFLPADMYVVETQKTRGGTDASGADTRPYRFGEFDILGVCLHPSTNRWTDFVFTVADWLIPDRTEPTNMLKFQPVSPVENEDWTANFEACVKWFRSDAKKTIAGKH